MIKCWYFFVNTDDCNLDCYHLNGTRQPKILKIKALKFFRVHYNKRSKTLVTEYFSEFMLTIRPYSRSCSILCVCFFKILNKNCQSNNSDWMCVCVCVVFKKMYNVFSKYIIISILNDVCTWQRQLNGWLKKNQKTLHGFFVNQGIWFKCNYNIDQKE